MNKLGLRQKNLKEDIALCLPSHTHVSIFHTMFLSFPSNWPKVLIFSTYVGLHYNLGFIFKNLYIGLAGLPWKDSELATYFMAKEALLHFLFLQKQYHMDCTVQFCQCRIENGYIGPQLCQVMLNLSNILMAEVTK